MCTQVFSWWHNRPSLSSYVEGGSVVKSCLMEIQSDLIFLHSSILELRQVAKSRDRMWLRAPTDYFMWKSDETRLSLNFIFKKGDENCMTLFCMYLLWHTVYLNLSKLNHCLKCDWMNMCCWNKEKTVWDFSILNRMNVRFTGFTRYTKLLSHPYIIYRMPSNICAS